MAKDYAARVEELCAFTQEEYGIDTADMRVLLAALVPCPGYRPCWLIADSPRHEFWYALGRAMVKMGWDEIHLAPVIRSLRPRKANLIVERAFLARHQPRIVQDYIFDEPPPPLNPRNQWRELEAACLRVRVRVNWMKVPGLQAEFELLRLLRLALDPEHRPFFPVPLPKPPEMLVYALGLVMSANPGLINPPETVKNALILPTSHAVLHGRDKLQERDHEVLLRVLQNTVRGWTWRVLRAFAESDGAMTMEDLGVETGLKREVLVRECGRLAEAGVLRWPKPYGRGTGKGNRRKWLRWEPGKGDDMRELVSGGEDGDGGGLRWWQAPVQAGEREKV